MALVVGVGCGDSTTANSDGGGGKAGGSGGKGGSAAAGTTGTGGSTAGTSGGGTGGSAAGTSGGGTSGGGAGGSAAGTSGGGAGGSAAGTSGGGAGGSAAGTSGGGRGGNTAGTGGNAAGAGGGGRGGNTAGTGGSTAGAGGGGRGGNTAGTGGRNADAGTDAETDARDAAPTCTNACTLGNHRCAGGGSETCVLGTNGCTQWGAASICAGVTTCAAGSGLCACPAAPTGCTAAGKFCSGTTDIITCNRDAQGCFSETAPAACPTDTTCKGTLPNAACTCDSNCAAVGNFCSDPKTVATCAADNNTPACLVVTSTSGCGGSSSCSAGACVCPAIGTTAGTGCATLAATACSGTDILTCVTETASGCSIWQASTHCATTGFTCGVKGGGTPACQCPANSGTDVYVDPIAGSDVVAGVGAVFPTGIQTPAACRYASLTNGLTKVGSPGRVIAISATLPVSFGAETFPLTIPTGISVLTADAVFNPADYVIDFAGTTAVKMSNGTALRGFTILNSGASQALVSCTAGNVVLEADLLNGAGTATDGLDVSGTCGASLTAVGIESLAGVALFVSSSGATSVTGGTISASLIGLEQTAGTVSATGVAVSGNGQYGILLPTSSAGTPSLTLAGSTAVSGNGVTGTFAGISIGKGSLTASNTSTNSNSGLGLQLTSAGTYQLTTVDASSNGTGTPSFGVGMTAGTLTSTGLTASLNSDSGVSVSAGSATFTAPAFTQNAQRGLAMSGGTVTISGGILNDNGLSGVFGSAGTLTVHGGTELAGNGTQGVHVIGAVTVVAGANIHNNATNGVLVADPTGVTVNIGSAATTTTISANGNDGILVNGAPATGGGANSVTIDTVSISTNGKFGIYLQGTAAATTATAATIKASTITANADVGIMIEQAGTNTTTEAIQNNDVNGNNTANLHTVGGILFNTSSTLTSFIGNKIHSNGGDELGFNALPNGALRWVINPPSAACDATANSLYCYGNGNVGLHILAGTETVDAQHVHWTNNPPTLGIDFSGPAGTVTVTNPCTVVTTCP